LVWAALFVSSLENKKHEGLLNSLHITEKYIESTNGFACVRMEHGAVVEGSLDITLRFLAPIPTNAEYTEFYLNKTLKVIHFDEHNAIIGASEVVVTEQRYPNIDSVIPTTQCERVPIVDPELLALPYTLFGDVAVVIRILPSSESTAIGFEFDEYVKEEYGNPSLFIMPRLPETFDAVKKHVEEKRKEITQ
ncbi:hypothetical protein V9948_004515, partial [Providencia rettgeri]